MMVKIKQLIFLLIIYFSFTQTPQILYPQNCKSNELYTYVNGRFNCTEVKEGTYSSEDRLFQLNCPLEGCNSNRDIYDKDPLGHYTESTYFITPESKSVSLLRENGEKIDVVNLSFPYKTPSNKDCMYEPEKCQRLANLCVLAMYDHTSDYCTSFADQKSESDNN